MTVDPLTAHLRGMFVAELEEQMRIMNADLLALEARPQDPARLKSLFRVAHTLKGAARAADVPLVERTCHDLESLLSLARDGKLTLDAPHFATLFAAADALAAAGAALAAGDDLDGSALAKIDAALRGDGVAKGGVPASGVPVEFAAASRRDPGAQMPGSPDTSLAGPTRPERAEAHLRLATEKLDALIAASGDLRVNAALAASQLATAHELGELAVRAAGRWRSAASDIRSAAVDGDASATQLLARMDEAMTALTGIAEQLAGAAAASRRQLVRSADAMTTRVQQLRMRAFAEICDALPRAVRDLSVSSGKEVQLRVEGGGVEVDRAVLDGLREPLLHLVRNAVDHGIERPSARETAGKPRVGTITVTAELSGDELGVTVSDDGAGVDSSTLRARLAEGGRPVPATDSELAELLFESGTSTRTSASAVSGRGVGLDLVRAAAERMGGHVRARWAAGHGTTFVLNVPISLASVRVVIVEVGGHSLALPTGCVTRLLRVIPAEVKRAEARDAITVSGMLVPLVPLARILGAPFHERAMDGVTPAVVIAVGERRVALLVDALLDECEVAVRTVESRHLRAPLVAGAAILASGLATPVLNPAAIVAGGLQPQATGTAVGVAAPAAPRRRRILVVDDSITTRTLEQSVLEAAGYDVTTAVDGAEGLKLLLERGADLVVTDVEMPRMGGLALCEAIRASARFARLPVVLVTALDSDAQRARGMEVGADAYLGKSSFDQQTLLDVVRQFVE